MTRVYVVCEGQTEAQFIEKALAPALEHRQIYLSARLIGTKGHQGGYFHFDRLCRDLKMLLLNDRHAYCTTLFDFYGLPETFPGKAEASRLDTVAEKAECLINAMNERLRPELGGNAMTRLISYVQMYEFEGILFSAPEHLARSINRPDLAEDFLSIRQAFTTPEEINNSPDSAPSKRILSHHRAYQKPTDGLKAVQSIGLEMLRKECPLFSNWLGKLETLRALA